MVSDKYLKLPQNIREENFRCSMSTEKHHSYMSIRLKSF